MVVPFISYNVTEHLPAGAFLQIFFAVFVRRLCVGELFFPALVAWTHEALQVCVYKYSTPCRVAVFTMVTGFV